MESINAEAASMAAATAAGSMLGYQLSNGLTVDEHYELVKSVELLCGSVVRIILVDEKTKEVSGTGTAFLVYRGDERSLFLTCNHNIEGNLCGQVIRLHDGDRDYPIEHIVYRHKRRDLLLFSVKDLPQLQCLELSTDEVKQNDRVVLVGFSGPTLCVYDGQELELALVMAPSILTGVVAVDPYEKEDDQHHEVIHYSCEAIKGISGSPLFKNGEVVAVHIISDKDWREGVSTKTVLHSLRQHLKVDTDNEPIDKLLEMLYNKSGHVPYDQPVKKGKRKARVN